MKPPFRGPLENLAAAYLSQCFYQTLVLLRLTPVKYRRTFLNGLIGGLTALRELSDDDLGDEAAVSRCLARLDAALEKMAADIRRSRRDGPSQAYPSEGN